MSGTRFALALKSGIHRVIEEQAILNCINVFPVADGDTGTNLTLTLGAALKVLERGEDHLGTVLTRLADALLDGARGNSGAILAQFFQGLSDSAQEVHRFTADTFSTAVAVGNEYARDAIAQPREGTILSVITAFAGSLRHQVVEDGEGQFSRILPAALARLEKALAKTTEQLDVLKKAGVVDAGAKGFVTLIDGIVRYLVDGKETPRPEFAALDEAIDLTAGSEDHSGYRYCTECIVTGTAIDRRKLRETLTTLGDSLVLAGTKRKAKVHIHVDEPDRAFDAAARFGTVSARKADDMRRQTHSSHDRVRRFAVITDSAADIPDDDLERLDIHIVPCRVHFGERSFIDKISIDSEAFFAEIERNPIHPTTSQPAPGDFRRQFQFLANHYSDVLSLNLSSRVSGTRQAAAAAAERLKAPGTVHVLDTLNVSTGQGLLTVFAAECAAAGMSLANTRRAIEKRLPLTRGFALVKDLTFAVRGGRVPGYVKPAAERLRITPIIRTLPDGRITNGGFLFGRRRRLRRFARHIVRHSVIDGPTHIAIGHALCADDARELGAILEMLIPDVKRATITELGSVLGVHGGPGTLVAATMPDHV